MPKSKSASKRMGKAHSQQRVVRLVLAGNHHQAVRYARQMGWQPNDWRYLASEANARGYRDVELHKVGTWYERRDAGEIMRVLEPIRQIGTLNIIEPNAEFRNAASGAPGLDGGVQ